MDATAALAYPVPWLEAVMPQGFDREPWKARLAASTDPQELFQASGVVLRGSVVAQDIPAAEWHP